MKREGAHCRPAPRSASTCVNWAGASSFASSRIPSLESSRATEEKMTSRRKSYSRTPSPDRRAPSPEDGRARKERKRHHEDGDSKPLPHGSSIIDDDDYFLKNAEFRLWLKEDKDRVSPPFTPN